MEETAEGTGVRNWKRPWFQFHLLTVVLATLPFGGLLGVEIVFRKSINGWIEASLLLLQKPDTISVDQLTYLPFCLMFDAITVVAIVMLSEFIRSRKACKLENPRQPDRRRRFQLTLIGTIAFALICGLIIHLNMKPEVIFQPDFPEYSYERYGWPITVCLITKSKASGTTYAYWQLQTLVLDFPMWLIMLGASYFYTESLIRRHPAGARLLRRLPAMHR